MATLSLSILGLYNYCLEHDDDLFESLTVPEEVDKDVLVNNIIMQAAPFETLYPDPDVMKSFIGIWSEANAEKWQKIADLWVEAQEFNPLENFDRTEEETIQNSGKDQDDNTQTRNLAGSDNRTVNLQDQRTANLTNERTANLTDQRTADLTSQRTANLTDQETRNLTDGETRNLTDEHKVSAYDSAAYSAKDQDTHTGTVTKTGTGTDTMQHTGTDTTKDTGTDTTTETGTDTVTQTGTDTTGHTGTDNRAMTDTGTVKDERETTYGKKVTRNARYHGNIGVTSLSQLLVSYAEASEDWDLYAIITQDFIKTFCVMVY